MKEADEWRHQNTAVYRQRNTAKERRQQNIEKVRRQENTAAKERRWCHIRETARQNTMDGWRTWVWWVFQ
jgi:hypothetical protein